nr:hypothetical protein [uncultured Bacteroides sp.]
MSPQSILSFKHNMTWGFIPVLLSMILSEFVPLGMAIYIGAILAIGLSTYTFLRKGEHLPQILLYAITVMLVMLAVTYYFYAASCQPQWYPFTLEIGTLLLILLFYLNRKSLVAHYVSSPKKHQPSIKNIEATIVSARVVLLFGFLHLLALLFAHAPLQGKSDFILHHVAPPAVFVLSILFNQIGISYFNRLMRRTVFVPVVNDEGDVTGKALASDALSKKQKYMIPFVRMAVTLNGMLYLCPRQQNTAFEKGKTDLPVEGYLLYGETLKQGLHRLVRQVLPDVPLQDLKFNFKYKLENKVTNRLVYVFTLTIDHESQLTKHKGRPGKLWTIPQIEQNLGQNFFCSSFEDEYNRIFSMIDECGGNFSAHNAH